MINYLKPILSQSFRLGPIKILILGLLSFLSRNAVVGIMLSYAFGGGTSTNFFLKILAFSTYFFRTSYSFLDIFLGYLSNFIIWYLIISLITIPLIFIKNVFIKKKTDFSDTEIHASKKIRRLSSIFIIIFMLFGMYIFTVFEMGGRYNIFFNYEKAAKEKEMEREEKKIMIQDKIAELENPIAVSIDRTIHYIEVEDASDFINNQLSSEYIIPKQLPFGWTFRYFLVDTKRGVISTLVGPKNNDIKTKFDNWNDMGENTLRDVFEIKQSYNQINEEYSNTEVVKEIILNNLNWKIKRHLSSHLSAISKTENGLTIFVDEHTTYSSNIYELETLLKSF